MLSASHIPGQQNLVALPVQRESGLYTLLFFTDSSCVPSSTVDFFTSSLAHLLPCYCARADDPDAWALDANFSIWLDFLSLHSLKFALLPRVLEKVASDLGIHPSNRSLLPKRPWFPLLLSHSRRSAEVPSGLNLGLLRQPVSLIQHPNPRVLHLTLWPLSAQPGVRQAFLSE